MAEPWGTMMRKDTGIPGSAPALRPRRLPLTALMVILTFLLGTLAAAPGAAAHAPAGPVATTSAAAQPAVKPGYGHTQKKTKYETERGQPRRTARASAGVPHHTGRQLPPGQGGPMAPPLDLPSGTAAAGNSTKAAGRTVQLPVLHCAFLC
ncbi:hypothetical protein ACH4TE_32880 [Streptomyces sioyaensis]|uniref:hypothetical protein n=1 Tax=Streptomyces sioyaensis TaxID=67364 RepID=UPI003797562B